MTNRCKIFDSQQVQHSIRRRIAYHTGIFTAVVLLALGLFLVLTSNARQPVLWGTGLVVFFGLPIAYLGYRIYQLSQVVWHIELSDQYVEGYDYARRKIRLAWDRISRIDLSNHALTLYDTEGHYITLPSEFTAFADVGHLIFDQAEQREIPLYVDGQSWQTLDVRTLFPFLEDDTPAAF